MTGCRTSTPVPDVDGAPALTGRPRVVVLRALNLGDLLTGIPALRALRRHFADYHLTLVAPAAFWPLVRREGLADALSDRHELTSLDPALAFPDVAVDLHGRGPGSQPLLLALRPERLIAFAHPAIPETRGFPDWRPGEHEVARWCRLLDANGIPADRADLALGRSPVAAPPTAVGATIIHPGAGAPSRRWPSERFAAVLDAEARAGRRVVLTGSVAERDLALDVARRAAVPAPVLAGSTDLDGLIAAVQAAGRVVSGDTGVAHLAFASGTPSVTLYGPVPPDEWGPPPGRPQHVALWAGRRGDPHATLMDPGLAAIGVDDVVAALAQVTAPADIAYLADVADRPVKAATTSEGTHR